MCIHVSKVDEGIELNRMALFTNTIFLLQFFKVAILCSAGLLYYFLNMQQPDKAKKRYIFIYE